MILKRVNPIDVGVNPNAILNIVNTLDKCNCHSLMILRHDKVICEGWWKPYKKDYNHVLFSLSKSFVATAICFAVQEGLLSFDDFVVNFFKDQFPYRPCENMEKVQIKHLLMMGYGHNVNQEPDWYLRENWLDENLKIYLEEEPGTKFHYDNRCPFLCSVILQRVTGLTVLDYLKPRLFEPLGIEGAWWESKNGINIGRGGLNLKTEDIGKFGLFLLHKGKINGKQLLKEEFIDQMTSFKLPTKGSGFTSKPVIDWLSGYGYFFWMCSQEGAFRADGACCQFSVVMPKQDIVVAITAGTSSAGQIILQSLWDNLTQNLDLNIENQNQNESQNEGEFEDKQNVLMSRLNSLHIPYPPGNYDFSYLSNYSGNVYLICENKMNITKLSIDFNDKFDTIRLWIKEEMIEVKAGHGEWIETDTKFHPEDFIAHTTFFFSNVGCSSAFDNNEYIIKFAFTRTPYCDTLKLKFDDKVILGEYICNPVMQHRGNRFQIMGSKI
ncbi:beta-lactamase [Tritrichomonas foetus]|uniref:Beta-lactamase n=1 Tax=Tritrichomonas foetus TaxID=1144522 RepID=A0A1J4KJ73_9EUKA|nr:beta-lactamase [Tritrichomonas foetus]|eukprot:OHT11391.1 beta-lactamase [Tritrichomonas foetus]